MELLLDEKRESQLRSLLEFAELHPTGAVIHGEPSAIQVADAIKFLAQLRESLQWCIGDLWNYGEGRFRDVIHQYFDKEYHRGTFRNWGWVCNAWEPSRRHDALSFSHHWELASLTRVEQDKYIVLAEKRGWTVRDLREHLAKAGKRDPVLAGEGDANRPDPMRVIDDELASHPERRVSLQARPDGSVMVDVEEGGECRSYGVDPDRLGEELADIMCGGRVPDSRRPVVPVRVVTCPQCGCEVELEVYEEANCAVS